MKILFSIQEQVQIFHIHDDIEAFDLSVIRDSMLRFFTTKPQYVVLDLSQATLSISETELQKTLSEIKTVAQTECASLVIAQTDIESMRAPTLVIEQVLQNRIQNLTNRLELREEIKNHTEALKIQNQKLRRQLENRQRPEPFPLSPLVEKLWRENESKDTSH